MVSSVTCCFFGYALAGIVLETSLPPLSSGSSLAQTASQCDVNKASKHGKVSKGESVLKKLKEQYKETKCSKVVLLK